MSGIRVHELLWIALVLSAPIVSAQDVSVWQWPVAGPFQSLSPSVFTGESFRIVPEAGAAERFRTVAPGTLVFRSPPTHREPVSTSALPRTAEMSLVAHENDFFSAYAVPEPPGGGDAPWFEFTIWDGTSQRQVNPRALLSRPEAAGGTTLPTMVFYQAGQRVAASELSAGIVSLVIEMDPVDRTRLPWKIRVFQNDRMRGSYRFPFHDAPSHEDGPVGDSDGEGRMELLRLQATPGAHTIIVEAVRFDRSVQRRTLRFTIPEPPPLGP